ncbi:hypothetical protein M126_0103 [Bacteroides fragilis str. S6L3]|uniref:Uncharacterized protein n=1 Tax=Bacteroides fragilis str. S36L11 TaxID=1339327 RepID=A0A016AR12_BACFG|nr:hypothetical protein M136_0098 [Bacteroides fragilis str. S36L11]EYA07084.1 hypothetical protein M126_0103 [Bacteroides fragilis str. S6L3]EYA87964.1 hypothetical protein M137_0235 [Bacteroides fragilis str. S36L12]EYE58533.1 hypothetical protein M127_0156 [Bacteroides fragilis str. S6L5]OCR43772.1 hypothetical protein AC141_01300 [Bacteroides fragilis]
MLSYKIPFSFPEYIKSVFAFVCLNVANLYFLFLIMSLFYVYIEYIVRVNGKLLFY